MEMNPNILPIISPGNRRQANMFCQQLVRRQRLPVTEEMKLTRPVQKNYDESLYNDERDQLEFNFEFEHIGDNEEDTCNCPSCRTNYARRNL